MMKVPWEIEINNNFDIMAKDSYYAIDVVSDEGYKTTVKTEIYTGTVLSDSIYAWDNKELSGGVYSNSVGFQTGQKFPIDMDLWLNSIIFKLTENTTSTKVNVHIYEMTNKELKLLTSVKSIKTKPGVTAE